MSYKKAQGAIKDILDEIDSSGLKKSERDLQGPQGPEVLINGKKVLNFCSNNYLGFSNDEEIRKIAKEAIDKYGFGLSSVRFIAGTQDIHKELEGAVARFHEKDDAILYSSCFDANTGLFETLLGEKDAVISDELNHASIIDGIRLCKAKRYIYRHSDMDDLRQKLILAKADGARLTLIATDGVFSMVGDFGKIDVIAKLAEEFDALVMVDESHATGFIGKGGRGASELLGVLDKVDIITSTFGKALGGVSGGFTAGRKEIIELLRQRSRPYLFSNSIPPVIAYTTLKALELISKSDARRKMLIQNTAYFKKKMEEAGFSLILSDHPITPIMIGDAKATASMAKELYDLGIFVVAFSYPVVPKDQARIRVQISSAHTKEQLDKAVDAFREVGRKLGIVQIGKPGIKAKE